MRKKQAIFWSLIPGLILLGGMLYMLITGGRQADAVRREVVRFHVVAHSDEGVDQELKIKVRNGVFALLKELFAGCESREEALALARERGGELQKAAEAILRENGCSAPVTLLVGERFFPTKTYGSLSFPAGNYQAVSLQIGAAEGKNFWCVLYPALCLAPAVAAGTAEEELTLAVGEKGVSFLKKADSGQRIRFALVEWFEIFRQKFLKS